VKILSHIFWKFNNISSHDLGYFQLLRAVGLRGNLELRLGVL